MAEDSPDELEMILEYDEEEVSSSDNGGESEDDGELGEFEDDENVNADYGQHCSLSLVHYTSGWKKELVRSLDFRHCNLHFMPEEVYDYEETLEELYVDSNNIKELPRSLFHCEFLKKLGASDNELCSIPPAVATLIHLEELDISKNAIVELPDNIKCCKNLTLVEISVNPLGRLPEGFTHLINLTQLYLNDTLLDFLPANFGRLTKLKILELRENHLKMLPKSMCRLTHLERLDLGQNDFKELPAVVGTLVNLKELWVDSNRLVQLPKSIGNLQLLTYFDASCNRIEFLPEETEGLCSLTDLHLTQNDLQELPKNIGKLSKLTTLKIDCNQLYCLPYSIGGLSSLEELILKANDLEEIPPSIGLLRKLRHLNIDQNMVLSVPAELGSCNSITLLSLCSNYLEVLPDEIGRISNLTVLNLSNNKLKYLPYSFTKLTKLQAMWLSDNQAKPLLQLQSDVLEMTGKRVLTCFMFPQQRRDPEEDFSFSDGESFHNSLWEEQRKQRRQIAFDVSESENERENTRLHRMPTPFPKKGVRLRPRMNNNNDSAPWHSSPITSQKTPRAHTSYPKEGVKQRHRKDRGDVQEQRTRLANKVISQDVNILQNYPDTDKGRGRRDDRMREAKISRPKASISPISDGLQLFRADKEMKARDKLRIRHSSPEKTDTRSDIRTSIESQTTVNQDVLDKVQKQVNQQVRSERSAMSDSEAFTPSSISSLKAHRLEMLETQSGLDCESHRGHILADTQSDVGFHIHRRNRQEVPGESQSTSEFRVQTRSQTHDPNQQRTPNYEIDRDGKVFQRKSQDLHRFSQLNRNTNAANDSCSNSSPIVLQKVSRQSGCGTDPEIERTRRKPQVRSAKEIRDVGYVHPSDYYKLPEYSVKDSPVRSFDLRPLRSKGHTGSNVPSPVKRCTRPIKDQSGSDKPLSNHQGLSKMQSNIQDVNNCLQHQTPSTSHRASPLRHERHSICRESRVKVHDDKPDMLPGACDGARQNHISDRRNYIDMTSVKSQSSPMLVRTRSTSPNRPRIPSYQEALSRYNETTPPRRSSPIQNGHRAISQPSIGLNSPQRRIRAHESGYEPMRTQSQSLNRRTVDSHSMSEHNESNQSQIRDVNSNNQYLTRNLNSEGLERILKPLDILSLTDVEHRVQDIERDSGNSSNVTWNESELIHNGSSQAHDSTRTGMDSPKKNAGVVTRREMHQDHTENDADSALTESPSPTYSSCGLTSSPQQPHFPSSVQVGSPMIPEGKVPILPNSHFMAPGMRPGPPKGLPPTYQASWTSRPESFPRDSSGYASESECKRVSPCSPSSFLVDNRPPSPNSTVLAWDTSPIEKHRLPRNISTTTGKTEGENGAKEISLVIYKNPGLGFSIAGGWNSPGNPYKAHDMGIFVTKIAPTGPADGTLQPGDKILEVNGHDFCNVTHDGAVNLLRSSNPVSLVIQRD